VEARVPISDDCSLKVELFTPTVKSIWVLVVTVAGGETIDSATSDVTEVYVCVATTPHVVLISVALGLGFPICV
jgi:hypothetical protein